MALTQVRVTGKYLSADGLSAADPIALSAEPPIVLPGFLVRERIYSKLKGDGEFEIRLYSDSAGPQTYRITETLLGVTRVLDVVVPATSAAELNLNQLAGYTQPAAGSLVKRGTLAATAPVDLTPFVKFADLTTYAKSTDLAVFALASTLAQYAKTTDLAGFVQSSSLSAYATIASLAGYATTTTVAGIGSRVTLLEQAPSESPTYANLPAGTTVTVLKNGGVWPARPTARGDIVVAWKGPDPSPPIVSTGVAGMRDNVDIRLVTP